MTQHKITLIVPERLRNRLQDCSAASHLQFITYPNNAYLLQRIRSEKAQLKSADAVFLEPDSFAAPPFHLGGELTQSNPALLQLFILAENQARLVTQAFTQGAFDVVIEPFNSTELNHSLQRLVRFIEHRNRFYQQALSTQAHPDHPVAESPAMRHTLHQLQQIQRSELPVLLVGETGTGKNVLASYVHRHSERKDGPFLTVNCGALSPTLLESELFGHEKGAFTGATQRRVGLLEAANGGTLFLDEINSASAELQVRLLQFIQERTLLRVGARSEVKVDVRLIFATNQPLRQLVDEGTFREDLYFRLHVFPIEIPPLRERLEDISHLAARFIFKYAPKLGKSVESCGPGVLDALLKYPWPGNIRELENVVQRILLSCQSNRVEVTDLPNELLNTATQLPHRPLDAHPFFPEHATLHEVERLWIEYSLQKFAGNKQKAAQALGVDPSTLWRKMKLLRPTPD